MCNAYQVNCRLSPVLAEGDASDAFCMFFKCLQVCPVTASHRQTVRSRLPLAIMLPFALNATLGTSLVCPLSKATF